MDETKKDELEWVAPEHPFRHKSGEWYASVSIIGGALAVAAIISGNFILAVLIIVSVIALLLISTIPPKNVSVAITRKGVEIGDVRYPFAVLESFWINEIDEPPRLLLKSKKVLSPLVVIELVEVEEDEARIFLQNYIEEEELYEPFFHRLFEYLGF